MSHLFPRRFGKLAAASALVVLPLVASASPIPTLYNTGVSAGHTVLANGAAETHYTLVSRPGGTASLRAARAVNGSPIPPWLGDDSLSDWIGPASDARLDGPGGTYDYRTTFDLTGFSPSTASITGRWAVDDAGVDILINGVSTGQTDNLGFTAFQSFSITSGFIAGINTIDFVVLNGSTGPTGLRVEMTGNVPEPGTVAMLAAGVLGMTLVRRRAKGPSSSV